MWPVLQSGDHVLVEYFEQPRPIYEFRPGEILLHREGGEWTVHRVIEYKNRLVLKGDFSNSYLFDHEPIVWGRIRGYKRGETKKIWSTKGPAWSKTTARLSGYSIESSGASRKVNKLLMFLLSKMRF